MASEEDVLSLDEQADQFKFVRKGQLNPPKDGSAARFLAAIIVLMVGVVAGVHVIQLIIEQLPKKTTDAYTLTRDFVAFTGADPFIVVVIAWIVYLALSIWVLDRMIVSIYSLMLTTPTKRISMILLNGLHAVRWTLTLVGAIAFGFYFM